MIPPVEPDPREVRRRQRSRALVTGVVLAAIAVLLYAITIAKIGLL